MGETHNLPPVPRASPAGTGVNEGILVFLRWQNTLALLPLSVLSCQELAISEEIEHLRKNDLGQVANVQQPSEPGGASPAPE